MKLKSQYQIIPIIPNKSQSQNPKTKKIWIWDFGFILDLVVFVILGFALNAHAQSLSSTELINNAKQYDGKTIIYTGEVIGEIMLRQDFAWVNVNDGQNAIGIWTPKDLIREIRYSGTYTSKGDWVEISGVFSRACLEHGGDLDIHAQELRKISSGRKISERLNSGKKNFALVLLGILCLIWILRQLKAK